MLNLLSFLLIKKQILRLKEILIIFSWIAGVILFFTFTHSPISEYYFSNLEVIFLTLIALLLTLLLKSSKIGFCFVAILLFIILCKNFYFYINWQPYLVGYVDRKEIVNFIATDAKNKGFPCFGVSYITRLGDNVGFRYFFYLQKQHLVHPSLQIPTYNIVIPSELSSETEKKFGHIGIITPTSTPTKEVIEKSCQTPDTNLTDSVFGYVE